MASDQAKVKSWGYAAVITGKESSENIFSGPCVYSLSDSEIQQLQEGDIVLIETNGRINLLFDIDSNDNAIIATERCNCRCIMCPQPPRHDSPGLQDLNLRLLRLMDPDRTTSICITGGEPTLLSDEFIQLLAECKKHLPRTPLAVLTNGKTFRDFKFTKKVVEVGHPDLTLCIALYADQDTLHDEIVGSPGSFYDTIKGITNLALFNQKIEIRNVVSARNYNRLPLFSHFIYRNFPFAVHVALMGMEMTGMALKNYDLVWIAPSNYMAQLAEAVKSLNRCKMHVSIYNLPLFMEGFMKNLFLKLAVGVVGILTILGLNFREVQAFAPHYSLVLENSPLYLQDPGSILGQVGTNWHSSHHSHYSHSSHESHSSHYSHYSSRY